MLEHQLCVALIVKCCNNGEYLITKTIILLKCVAGGNSAELCEIVWPQSVTNWLQISARWDGI